ncbi:Uncharacterised protein [Enterobacter hormaechei]|nr:Uncharacterised protein [Enterobacter hormaechei]
MCTLCQRRCRRDAPGTVRQNRCAANRNAVIVNRNRAAWFSSARQAGLRLVGKLPGGNRAFQPSGVIVNDKSCRHRRGGDIHRYGKGRRGRTGVTGDVGGAYGKLVAAFAQVNRRRKAPASVAAYYRCANGNAVIIDGDRRARFRRAGELRARIVSGASASEHAGIGRNVVGHAGDGRGTWCDRIHHEGHRRGRRAGIACRIGRGGGNGVVSFRQVGRRGKAPFPGSIGRGGADRLAVVIEGNNGASFTDATERRACIVRALSVAQRARFGAHVIIDGDNLGGSRRG